MKAFAIAFCFLLLLTPALASADLTGKWSGSFVITGPDGQTEDEHAYMDFKHTGSALTGTAGPNPDKQWPIQKGKVEGDKATFEVQTDGPLMTFELTLAEGHLKGMAKAEFQGQMLKATIDLQRETK